MQAVGFVSLLGWGGFSSLQIASSLYGSLLGRANDASAVCAGWRRSICLHIQAGPLA